MWTNLNTVIQDFTCTKFCNVLADTSTKLQTLNRMWHRKMLPPKSGDWKHRKWWQLTKQDERWTNIGQQKHTFIPAHCFVWLQNITAVQSSCDSIHAFSSQLIFLVYLENAKCFLVTLCVTLCCEFFFCDTQKQWVNMTQTQRKVLRQSKVNHKWGLSFFSKDR